MASLLQTDSLLNSEVFPSTEDQTDAGGDSKGVYQRASSCTIAFMLNELQGNEQICLQSTEAEIPTLLKVTAQAADFKSKLRKSPFTLKSSIRHRLQVFQRVRWALGVMQVVTAVLAVWTGRQRRGKCCCIPTKKICCNYKCTPFGFHRWTYCGLHQGPRGSMQHQGTVCKGGRRPWWSRVPWRPAVNAALLYW